MVENSINLSPILIVLFMGTKADYKSAPLVSPYKVETYWVGGT